MTSLCKAPVLFFSSLAHGGGRTFAETYIASLREAEITISTLYDFEAAKSLANEMGVRALSIVDPRLLLNPRTVVISNSQICAAIGSIFYPGRHYYVTHGYANGLDFAPAWRRIAWKAQVNIPGTNIIACGDNERDAIARICLNSNRVSLIRNGLPQKIIRSEGARTHFVESRIDEAHLAYVGRICFQKGLDVLLRALRHPQLRDRKIKLSIIGNYQEGETKYCEVVRNLIKEDQVSIDFLPPQSIDSSFYLKFSALVSPSRFEGLPYTLLEAGYAGSPIILSDCPGNIDVVPDERYGYIFRTGDDNSLAEALIRFLDSNNQERDLRGRRLRERVTTEFSESKFCYEYLKLLR